MSKKKNEAGKKKASKAKVLQGRLEVSRSGMGFVIVEGLETDILVKPNNFGKAFNGDIVQVHVDKPAGRGGKRDEGVVVKIIERKQTEFTGTLDINNNKIAFFVHGSDKGIPDFYIPMDKLNGAQNGDRVVARFVKWEKDDRKPQGEVVTVMDAKN